MLSVGRQSLRVYPEQLSHGLDGDQSELPLRERRARRPHADELDGIPWLPVLSGRGRTDAVRT